MEWASPTSPEIRRTTWSAVFRSGGVSIFGGKGNLIGVGLSLLVILNLRNGMGLADITGNTQNYVVGGLQIWRGQHIRGKRQSDRRRPVAARDLESSQWNGPRRHHRKYAELRGRRSSDLEGSAYSGEKAI